MYSSRVWTVRPLGIFLDSFVEVFFGCCFAVALGLDPPDPDAAARAGALFFAVFGADACDVRLPFDAAEDLFFFFLVMCASFSGVFAGQFLVIFRKRSSARFTGSLIMVHFELHHFCRHFDAASHTPGKSKPCGLFQSPTRGLWQKYQAFHSRMRSMS